MRGVFQLLLLGLAVGALVAAKPYLLPEKPLEVEIFRAAPGIVRETVTSPSSGTIASRHEAVVSSEAMGRVAEVLFERGDRVDRGAVVVALEDRDAEVEVRAAEAALATRRTALDSAQFRLAKAEEDYTSAAPLHETRLISDDQHRVWRTIRDTARSDVAAARSAVGEAEVAVERARVVLSRRRVTAPFAGVIRRKLVEAGAHVVVGTPCFEIYDDARIFVKAPVDEVDLPRIRPGLSVDVALEPFGERIFAGVLRVIEPGVQTAKELNRTGEVEVDLKDLPAPGADGSYPPGDGPIRIGMSADIEVIVRTRPDALRVPAYAVHEQDETRYVFVVTDGKIEKRTVRTGLANWDFAEIAEGLREGEAVVVSLDMKDLVPGKAAKVVKEVKRVEVE